MALHTLRTSCNICNTYRTCCEHHKLLIHHFVMSITLLMEWKSYISYLMSHYVKIQCEKRISTCFSYKLKERKAESLKSVTLAFRLGMCQYKIGSGQIEKKVLPRQTGNCKSNSRSWRQWSEWVRHTYQFHHYDVLEV